MPNNYNVNKWSLSGKFFRIPQKCGNSLANGRFHISAQNSTACGKLWALSITLTPKNQQHFNKNGTQNEMLYLHIQKLITFKYNTTVQAVFKSSKNDE